jgi:DNA-binding XRE family transcriptional regulator
LVDQIRQNVTGNILEYVLPSPAARLIVAFGHNVETLAIGLGQALSLGGIDPFESNDLECLSIYQKRKCGLHRAKIRAARGLAGIDQATLSKSAEVSRKTIVAIENDQNDTMDYRRVKAIQLLRKALEEKHDIEFLKANGSKGVGVRIRR